MELGAPGICSVPLTLGALLGLPVAGFLALSPCLGLSRHCFPSIPDWPHFWVAVDNLESPASCFVRRGLLFTRVAVACPPWMGLDGRARRPLHGSLMHWCGCRETGNRIATSGGLAQAVCLEWGPSEILGGSWDTLRDNGNSTDVPRDTSLRPKGPKKLPPWEKFLCFHSRSLSPDPFHIWSIKCSFQK